MMKVKTVGADGRPIVLLGLSHANLDELRRNGLQGYIRVAGDALEIGFDILITAAENEQVMIQSFAEFVGPDTKVTIDKRFKS